MMQLMHEINFQTAATLVILVERHIRQVSMTPTNNETISSLEMNRDER